VLPVESKHRAKIAAIPNKRERRVMSTQNRMLWYKDARVDTNSLFQ